MQIVVDSNQFKPAVQRLQLVAARNGSVFILGCISIRTLSAEEIQLTATDQEAELIVTIRAQVEEHGHWAVDAQQLARAIVTAPDGGQIAIKYLKRGSRLDLRHGRSEYKLPCFNGEDMPHLKVPDIAWAVGLAGGDLENLLGIRVFAEKPKGPRIMLQGVTLQDRNGQICAYSSDGHRAMRAQSDVATPDGFMPLIISTSNCGRILDLFRDSTSVTFSANQSTILIEGGAFQFVSKLIDCQPIDIEQIIPRGGDMDPIKLNRKTLSATVDALIGLADKGAKALRFVALDRSIHVSLSEKSEAEGECFMDADCVSSPETTGLNGSYVRDMCGAFDHEEVTMRIGGNGVPVMFEAENSPRTGCIMQVRVQSIDPATIGAGGE